MAEIVDAARCGYDGWALIWGDPLLIGTTLVLAYAITAVLVFRVARQLARKLAKREQLLWQICGAILLFQAVNTPLDLHAFVWSFGKCLAHAQGWYDARTQVKAVAALGAMVLAVVTLAAAFTMFRHSISRNLLLLAGIGMALGFTIFKGIHQPQLAASDWTIGPFHITDWAELLGIFLAFGAAMRRQR